MSIFVALYRGINVGGKHTVKMESLRAMHEMLGHQGVKSYIQSGNVVFTARGSAATAERKITGAFGAVFGFAAKVMLLESKRWSAIVADNPYTKFAAAEPRTVHVGICQSAPSAEGLHALLKKTGGRETFAIDQGIIYLHTPDGLGKSKFAAGMEKAGGVPMTMRNWRTIEAIEKLAGAKT